MNFGWAIPVVLLALLALFGWMKSRAGEKIGGVVNITDSGISVRAKRLSAKIAWTDVFQINLARLPSYIDYFCVILIDNKNNQVVVYDDYVGFERFRDEMLRRWPQIDPEWVRVHNGSPDIEERVTVWKRESAS